jgi:hypothetical protein
MLTTKQATVGVTATEAETTILMGEMIILRAAAEAEAGVEACMTTPLVVIRAAINPLVTETTLRLAATEVTNPLVVMEVISHQAVMGGIARPTTMETTHHQTIMEASSLQEAMEAINLLEAMEETNPPAATSQAVLEANRVTIRAEAAF